MACITVPAEAEDKPAEPLGLKPGCLQRLSRNSRAHVLLSLGGVKQALT